MYEINNVFVSKLLLPMLKSIYEVTSSM